MTIDDEAKIRAAWETYHGPVNSLYGDEIPQAPPAYERGYRDGYRAGRTEGMSELMKAVSEDAADLASEIRAVLEQLDRIGGAWCDCVEFKECRARLRALLSEGK